MQLPIFYRLVALGGFGVLSLLCYFSWPWIINSNSLRPFPYTSIVPKSQLDLTCNLTQPVAVTSHENAEKDLIYLATTACGESCDFLFITLLKSLYMSKHPRSVIHFYVTTDPACTKKLTDTQRFGDLISKVKDISGFSLYFVTQPGDVNLQQFPSIKTLYWDPPKTFMDHLNDFRLCSSNRLWVHEMLPQVDKILYLDLDTVVIADLWPIYQDMTGRLDSSSSALFAAAEEALPGSVGFYAQGANWVEMSAEEARDLNGKYKTSIQVNGKGAHFPFFLSRGINAGVLFIHLERLRARKFTQKLVEFYDIFPRPPLGDQGVLNFFGALEPTLFLVAPCTINIRTDTYGSCASYRNERRLDLPTASRNFSEPYSRYMMTDFPYVLHGNRQVFNPKNNPQNLKLGDVTSDLHGWLAKMFVLIKDADYP